MDQFFIRRPIIGEPDLDKLKFIDVYSDEDDIEFINPYDGYTIECQARDLQISVEECIEYNASHLTWLEWLREQEIM